MIRVRLACLAALLATFNASALHAQGCLAAARPGASNHMRIDDDRRVLSVRWLRGDCEIRVDARGDFSVRADLSGISRIDEGGYLEIEERDGARERKVRISSGPGGLQFRWTVDGEPRFDVDRDRWLADILIAVERRTAMFAKSRVPELVRQGGPGAVLDETARMDSDHARRVYYTTLLSIVLLDEATTERLLQQASVGMRSDHERSELLRAVARHGPMTDHVTRAVIRVAQSLASDYEKRRALSAWLESARSLEARNALFTAAATMRSNYELAELLIAAQHRSMVDSLSRIAFFEAVGRLTSDYEHRRTLSALLEQRPRSQAVLADVLRSSEGIDSDHELATLLVEFTRVTPVRGELRELYLRAARSLGSDHEYRRALQALLDQDRRT